MRRWAPYIISATLAPVAVLGNYDITATTASFDIAKKTASVAPAAAGKIYGAADPTLAGSLSGFLAGDTVTATYSRTAGETVRRLHHQRDARAGGGARQLRASPHTTASFDIAKKTASVTPAATRQDLRRGRPDADRHPGGFLAADGVTASYSRTAGETVGAYVISATLAPAAVLGNYNITSSTAKLRSSRRKRPR